MNRRLPTWMILAGGTALAAAGFFASTGITHWVMGLRHTDVVIRPGPTIYLPSPTGHHHAHHLPGFYTEEVTQGQAGWQSQRQHRFAER